jgi:uncharacterized protein YndB with AHSA1/START domain
MRRAVTIALSLLAAPVFAQPATDAAPAARTPAAPPAPALNTAPIVHEIELDVPPTTIWDVFATAEGWKKWGVAQVEIDFRVGGLVKTHYNPKGVIGDEGTIHNQIIAFEPGRMVAWRIAKPPKGLPYQNAWKDVWSVATFWDTGRGTTTLRLAMCGYTADEESQKMRAFFDQGNAWSLQKLKQNLEAPATAQDPGDRMLAVIEKAEADRKAAFATADPLAPITVEATVRATPSEVWRCWTTSEGVESFLTRARVELRVGGPFELYFGGDDVPAGQRGSEGCTILSYDPQRMLSFTWNAPPKLAHARQQRTWVVVRIDPHGPHASKVSLKHMGFTEKAAEFPEHAQEWKETRAYFSNAWPKVMEALKAHFEPKGTAEAPKQ